MTLLVVTAFGRALTLDGSRHGEKTASQVVAPTMCVGETFGMRTAGCWHKVAKTYPRLWWKFLKFGCGEDIGVNCTQLSFCEKGMQLSHCAWVGTAGRFLLCVGA